MKKTNLDKRMEFYYLSSSLPNFIIVNHIIYCKYLGVYDVNDFTKYSIAYNSAGFHTKLNINILKIYDLDPSKSVEVTMERLHNMGYKSNL